MKRVPFILFAMLSLCLGLHAQDGVQPMRRPLSPTQPMWIVHIDSWNYPDPEKIIRLIPEDLRPFVVFNISLSSNSGVTHDGPRIADSWIRTAAAHRVWCMIQPSSGAHNRLPEITADGQGLESYEQYFRQYPNFIGFSFCEQFWGFGKDGCPTWEERQTTYLHVLQLCRQYGGYLTMSFTQAYDNCLMMPMGILKNNAQLRAFLQQYPEHFICCEKTTMKKCFYDIESNCLGMWLSGYAGHYGNRFDTSGWMSGTDEKNNSDNNPYVEAAGIAHIIEHMLLTGQTVLDGPELTWQQVTSTYSMTTIDQNYKTKSHHLYPHCINIYADIMRKIIAGEWRILSREEVIDRTKICIINDFTSGDRDPYVTPKYLFNGIYRFDCDQGGVSYGTGWQDQRWWTKSTGRYPTIPQIYGFNDALAEQLTAIPASTVSTRWSTRAKKQSELNTLFPAISTGDLYVAKAGNTYVTYNPYQYCDTLIGDIRTFSNATRFARAVITGPQISQGDSMTIYLNNYRNAYQKAPYQEEAQQTNRICLTGLQQPPHFQLCERGKHSASTLQTSFEDGVFTMTITHNGPVEISLSQIYATYPTIDLTYAPYTAGVISISPTLAMIQTPALPDVYSGVLQYEVEDMDYQGSSIKHYNRPKNNTLTDYYGQGYLTFVPNKNIYIRDTVQVLQEGQYTLTIRYRNTDTTSPVPLTLRVNGNAVPLSEMPHTEDWYEVSTSITLHEGINNLTFGCDANWGSSTVALDMIQLNSLVSNALPNTPATQNTTCRKHIINGMLLIEHNAQLYTVLGNKLK